MKWEGVKPMRQLWPLCLLTAISHSSGCHSAPAGGELSLPRARTTIAVAHQILLTIEDAHGPVGVLSVSLFRVPECGTPDGIGHLWRARWDYVKSRDDARPVRLFAENVQMLSATGGWSGAWMWECTSSEWSPPTRRRVSVDYDTRERNTLAISIRKGGERSERFSLDLDSPASQHIHTRWVVRDGNGD
jgi:hypothetical protein